MLTPTTIRGITYPSRTAAARALGIHPMTLTRAIREGKLQTAGTGRNKAIGVTIDGQSYPSIQKASRTLGIPFSTLQKAVRRGDYGGAS